MVNPLLNIAHFLSTASLAVSSGTEAVWVTLPAIEIPDKASKVVLDVQAVGHATNTNGGLIALVVRRGSLSGTQVSGTNGKWGNLGISSAQFCINLVVSDPLPIVGSQVYVVTVQIIGGTSAVSFDWVSVLTLVL